MGQMQQQQLLQSAENRARAQERGQAAVRHEQLDRRGKRLVEQLEQLQRAQREHRKMEIAASDPAKAASLLAR